MNPDEAYDLVNKLEGVYMKCALRDLGAVESMSKRNDWLVKAAEARVAGHMKGMFQYILSNHCDANTHKMIVDYIAQAEASL